MNVQETFVRSPSPLAYKHTAPVQRLALVVPGAGAARAGETYFAPTTVTANGKREALPGAGDDVVAFIDWHETPYGVMIDFMSTRSDYRRLGCGTLAALELRSVVGDGVEIDFGKVMHDGAERIFRRVQALPGRVRAKLC